MPNQLEPEYADAFHTWKTDPSPANTDAVLQKVAPVVGRAVTAFGAGGGPLAHGRARRMVLDALPGYDPERAKLGTYLTTHLQGLRRSSHRQGMAVRVPERVLLDRQHLVDAEGYLADQLGRPPNDVELADHTGLSLRRITKVRTASAGRAEGSILAPTEGGGNEQIDPAVGAVRHAADDGWLELVYHSVGPTDRLILEHSLGLHGKPILENRALAARLRVTPAAISQHRLRLQRALDAREELGVA